MLKIWTYTGFEYWCGHTKHIKFAISILEKEDPSQKSAAIRTRRKRESRRPTGKITLEDIQVSNKLLQKILNNACRKVLDLDAQKPLGQTVFANFVHTCKGSLKVVLVVPPPLKMS